MHGALSSSVKWQSRISSTKPYLCACSQTTLARLLSYLDFIKCITLSSELNNSWGVRKITSLLGIRLGVFWITGERSIPWATPQHLALVFEWLGGVEEEGLEESRALWKPGNLRYNFHFTSWLTTSKSVNNSCILKIYSVYSGYNESRVKRLEAIKVTHTETQASKYGHQCELRAKQLKPHIPGCQDGVERYPLTQIPQLYSD